VSAPAFWRVLLAKGPGWYAWAAMTPLIFRLAHRYPLRAPLNRTAVLVHCLGCALACLVHAAVWSLGNWVALYRATEGYMSLLSRGLLGWLPISVPIYFGLVGGAHWLLLARANQENARRTAALEGELTRAKLQSLRMQLHPHFLFNALNTISVLVRERETDVAVQLIARLGDVLRRVLQTRDVHEVPLSEELLFTRQYLKIEEVRFADRLRVRWEVDEDVAETMVPHLVLQPLVENALRHGVAHREDDGEIEIGARRDGERILLWVSDNGPGYHPTGRAPGIGLANVRGRLTGLYGESATLTVEAIATGRGDGCRATIALPSRPSPTTPSAAAEAVAHV
jgi:signal transduction histidine kinase